MKCFGFRLTVAARMVAAACLVGIFSAGIAASPAPSAPVFSFLAKPGPHSVGLRVVEQYDYSRSFRPSVDDLGKPYIGERARPLQTLIWYPALKGDSKPMTFGAYIALRATEVDFGNTQPPVESKDSSKGYAAELPTVMWAVRDARPAHGRFPIVIYAPSFSSISWENADICEYLASHGYVVIASPSMGRTRQSTLDLAGAEAQARDISFLIGYAQTLPDTDPSQIGVVGFSWGGLSQLFAAARDDRIDALVSLDGSMRYFPGIVKRAGDIDPGRMTIPLLYFKEQSSLEDTVLFGDKNWEGPSVLNAWTHGDLTSVQMLGLVHLEFCSVRQRSEEFWNAFPEFQPADYGREDGAIGYAWVARYTKEFLDAYLKRDPQALQYLKNKPSENGVPVHVMGVNFRGARGVPPSFSSFRAEAAGVARAMTTSPRRAALRRVASVSNVAPSSGRSR